MTSKDKTEWRTVAARVAGILVLLAGVLLAAGLCTASPRDNPVPSIFEPHSHECGINLSSVEFRARHHWRHLSGRLHFIEFMSTVKFRARKRAAASA